MAALAILVVMDEPARIKAHKDSTVAMMLEAQARGHALWVAQGGELLLDRGQAAAAARPVRVADRPDWLAAGDRQIKPLRSFGLILMRQDPPVDADYLAATWVLDHAVRDGVLVVNAPSALRDANEKLAATWFPECMAPSLVTANAALLREFVAREGHAVLKPLHGMGGSGIFQAAAGDPNLNVIIETMTAEGRHAVMAQRYIPEARTGDKRILLIAGEAVPHALLRVPPDDDFRGNLARGGRGRGVDLTDRDRWIVSRVGPELNRRGVLFAGLDVIGEALTEINITSPTCIRELDRLYDINIAAQLFDVLEARCSA